MTSFTTDAQKSVSVFVAEGVVPSTVGFRIRLEDTTAPATRLDVLMKFDASGVPQAVSEDTGVLLRVVKVALTGGKQIFRLEFLSTAVLFANTHQVEIQPHDAGDGGDVFATGVQVDDAPFVTTYKATTGASVTGTILTDNTAENVRHGICDEGTGSTLAGNETEDADLPDQIQTGDPCPIDD